MSRAADHDGACLDKKDRDAYQRDYPDISQSPHARLLSLSVEPYGRWGRDCLRLVRELSAHKGSQHPEILRISVAQVYSRRWWGILSAAVQKSIAASISRLSGHELTEADDSSAPPSVLEVLDCHR